MCRLVGIDLNPGKTTTATKSMAYFVTTGDSQCHNVASPLRVNSTGHSSVTPQLQSSLYATVQWHYVSVDLQLIVVLSIGFAIAIRVGVKCDGSFLADKDYWEG